MQETQRRPNSYKAPGGIEFRNEFPMTDTGKVAKRKLVEEAKNRTCQNAESRTA